MRSLFILVFLLYGCGETKKNERQGNQNPNAVVVAHEAESSENFIDLSQDLPMYSLSYQNRCEIILIGDCLEIPNLTQKYQYYHGFDSWGERYRAAGTDVDACKQRAQDYWTYCNQKAAVDPYSGLKVSNLIAITKFSNSNRFFKASIETGTMPIEMTSKVDGGFGVAVSTWDFNAMRCYDYFNKGGSIYCKDDVIKMYSTRTQLSGMGMRTYDVPYSKQLGFDKSNTLNISSFHVLDPNANTQYLWFHYERLDAPENFSGKYRYYVNESGERIERNWFEGPYPIYRKGVDTIAKNDATGLYGAEIYAFSGAPGAVRVRFQYTDAKKINNRTSQWIMRPSEGIYQKSIGNVSYWFCKNCIYKEKEFFNFLRENHYFHDSQGQWYSLYLLSEVEYGLRSHYLEPRDAAAVVNHYAERLISEFGPAQGQPRIRFILGSPVKMDLDPNNVNITYTRDYYKEMFGLLTPQALSAIQFVGLDAFIPPPKNWDAPNNIDGVVRPDFDKVKDGIVYPAISKGDLELSAEKFVRETVTWANMLNEVTGKKVILTQTGVHFLRPIEKNLALDSIFAFDECPWCTKNEESWKTIQFGSARLVQLVYKKFKDLRNKGESPILAWSYWGDIMQDYWTYKFMNQGQPREMRWGNINHGIHNLAWPVKCITDKSVKLFCPNDTKEVWPSYTGMVYLKMANKIFNYRPPGAPSWWVD